jgi:hypothetical protein
MAAAPGSQGRPGPSSIHPGAGDTAPSPGARSCNALVLVEPAPHEKAHGAAEGCVGVVLPRRSRAVDAASHARWEQAGRARVLGCVGGGRGRGVGLVSVAGLLGGLGQGGDTGQSEGAHSSAIRACYRARRAADNHLHPAAGDGPAGAAIARCSCGPLLYARPHMLSPFPASATRQHGARAAGQRCRPLRRPAQRRWRASPRPQGWLPRHSRAPRPPTGPEQPAFFGNCTPFFHRRQERRVAATQQRGALRVQVLKGSISFGLWGLMKYGSKMFLRLFRVSAGGFFCPLHCAGHRDVVGSPAPFTVESAGWAGVGGGAGPRLAGSRHGQWQPWRAVVPLQPPPFRRWILTRDGSTPRAWLKGHLICDGTNGASKRRHELMLLHAGEPIHASRPRCPIMTRWGCESWVRGRPPPAGHGRRREDLRRLAPPPAHDHPTRSLCKFQMPIFPVQYSTFRHRAKASAHRRRRDTVSSAPLAANALLYNLWICWASVLRSCLT